MKYFILDVDGVLTTGQFLYSSDGKVMKVFGPDDNESLGLLQKYDNIIYNRGQGGFEISKNELLMKWDIHWIILLKRLNGFLKII